LILLLVPAFKVVVDKRRAGSNSRLGTALAAVWAGIVVFWAAVVGPVVAVERESRRCGGMGVG
jgi:hypothetical protein